MLSTSHRLLYPLVLLLVATPPLLSYRLARPAPSAGNKEDRAGMTMDEKRGAAIMVTSLMNAGPATRAGVAVGDEVRAINRRRVTTLRMARRLIDTSSGCSQILYLRRGRAALVAAVAHMHGGSICFSRCDKFFG